MLAASTAWSGQGGGGTPKPSPPRKPNRPGKPAPAKPETPPENTSKPGPGGGVNIDWSDPASYQPPPGRYTQAGASDGIVIDERWNNYFNMVSVLAKAIEAPQVTETSDPIAWLYSIKEARAFAQTHSQPFVVYVCDEQRFPIAGEGAEAWVEYKLENGGTTPPKTIFESAEVQKAFRDAGIVAFVKIEHSAANARLVEKLKVTPNTLLIVAPNGEQLAKLSGEECEPERVCRYLASDFQNQLDAWVERCKALNAAVIPAPN